MKKILAFFTIFSCLTSSTLAVSACTKEYNHFLVYIKDKESFVYVIKAADCSACKDDNHYFWSRITDGDDINSWKKLIQKQKYSPTTLWKDPKSTGAVNYQNMHFYSYQVDKVADVFDDSSVKKIIDYIITKTEDFLKTSHGKIDYLKRSDLGIDGLPLYLYFDSGQYEGFSQGGIYSKSDTDPQKDCFTNLMIQIIDHIVHHHLNIKK